NARPWLLLAAVLGYAGVRLIEQDLGDRRSATDERSDAALRSAVPIGQNAVTRAEAAERASGRQLQPSLTSAEAARFGERRVEAPERSALSVGQDGPNAVTRSEAAERLAGRQGVIGLGLVSIGGRRRVGLGLLGLRGLASLFATAWLVAGASEGTATWIWLGALVAVIAGAAM